EFSVTPLRQHHRYWKVCDRICETKAGESAKHWDGRLPLRTEDPQNNLFREREEKCPIQKTTAEKNGCSAAKKTQPCGRCFTAGEAGDRGISGERTQSQGCQGGVTKRPVVMSQRCASAKPSNEPFVESSKTHFGNSVQPQPKTAMEILL